MKRRRLSSVSPVLLAAVAAMATACAQSEPEPARGADLPVERRVAERYDASLDVDLDAMERLYSGLYIHDVRVGDGARADSGDVVTVHYTGWLPTGRAFDSSRDGDPFQVALGYGRVIDGWDQGLIGMREGGRRRLVIPPLMGYGERGSGPIPGNATLVFDVELIGVEDRVPEGAPGQ
jgi:FKBP-type peptidyl-prolyl cis-trans isomerase